MQHSMLARDRTTVAAGPMQRDQSSKVRERGPGAARRNEATPVTRPRSRWTRTRRVQMQAPPGRLWLVRSLLAHLPTAHRDWLAARLAATAPAPGARHQRLCCRLVVAAHVRHQQTPVPSAEELAPVPPRCLRCALGPWQNLLLWRRCWHANDESGIRGDARPSQPAPPGAPLATSRRWRRPSPRARSRGGARSLRRRQRWATLAQCRPPTARSSALPAQRWAAPHRECTERGSGRSEASRPAPRLGASCPAAHVKKVSVHRCALHPASQR